MLRPDDVITAVDHDDDLGVVVVRAARRMDYEEKLRRKTLTSGCVQGIPFGDLMDGFSDVCLSTLDFHTIWLYRLLHRINTVPSLYIEAGAIHEFALCFRDSPITYLEDVGRHNAVDKIAGWMFRTNTHVGDKIFYITGRLTSEMVIKTVRMGIPVLISRSGFTAWGVELAREAGLILIGGCKSKRFMALAGEDRIIFDVGLRYVEDESVKCLRNDAQEEMCLHDVL